MLVAPMPSCNPTRVTNFHTPFRHDIHLSLYIRTKIHIQYELRHTFNVRGVEDVVFANRLRHSISSAHLRNNVEDFVEVLVDVLHPPAQMKSVQNLNEYRCQMQYHRSIIQ